MTRLLELPETASDERLIVSQEETFGGYVRIEQSPGDEQGEVLIVMPERIRALRDALTRALANLPPGSNA